MTNTPNFIMPVSPEGDESVSPGSRATRPASGKPTPSQEGRFLGALEKRGQKKVGGKTPGTEEEEEEASATASASTAAAGDSVFRLAKGKREKALTGSSTGEEMVGEEGSVKGAPAKKKPVATPPSPDTTQQQIAAAQGQLPVPTPIVGAEEEGEPTSEAMPVERPMPGRVAQKGTVQEQGMAPQGSVTPRQGIAPQGSVTPKQGVAPAQKGGGAFDKLMGEGGTKREPPSTELAAGTVLPKPIITPSLIAEAPAAATPQQASHLAMMQLISQSAEALATFVSRQQTSTVVTIQNPPLFAGATLTVTEYSSAPQQLNITFANLTPQAQRMIENMANQQQLKQALFDRGYTVQNVFIQATPEAISAPPSTGGPSLGGQAPRDFGGGEQGGAPSGGTGGETGGAE